RIRHTRVSRDWSSDVCSADLETIRRSSLDEVVSWDLTEKHLGLTGIHPEFGEVTLRQLLATWVVHDQTHIRQIAVTIARRYEARSEERRGGKGGPGGGRRAG